MGSSTTAAKPLGKPETASTGGSSSPRPGSQDTDGLQRSLDDRPTHYKDAVELARGEHDGIVWQLWVTDRSPDNFVEFKQAWWVGGIPRRNGGGGEQAGSPIDASSGTSREPGSIHWGTVSMDTVSVRVHMLDGREIDVALIDRSMFSNRYFVAFITGPPDYYLALGKDGTELGRFHPSGYS